MISEDLKEKILKPQRNEITEYIIYKKLSCVVKVEAHREVLERISQEELKHYEFFKGITQQDVSPDKVKIFIYSVISKIFGLNFGLRLMENGESLAQDDYDKLQEITPGIIKIVQEEEEHENRLIDLINEERLKYASSVVLGLNDALVELSGALVGFTLALQNTRIVAIVGLITGIAASMSMAASEYLSTKDEDAGKSPLKASIYTGIAYVATVLLLVAPYFILKNIFFSLALVIINALLVVLIFTFYISVAKGLSFRKRFLEMAGISLGIAAMNFIVGIIIRKIFAID